MLNNESSDNSDSKSESESDYDHDYDSSFIQSIEDAVTRFKQGEFVIVMDDLDRENEGDLIISAQHITTEKMNFMIQNTTGIICCPMTQERANSLRLHKMTSHNTDKHGTAFTVTCDAKENITTGVSAHDRAYTANLLADMTADASAFNKPGHMFPLVAKEGGVLTRKGHTEASIDLCELAKLTPVAVIGELMNSDGTMSRLDECQKLSALCNIPIITIEDLVKYKRLNKDIEEANKEENEQKEEPKEEPKVICVADSHLHIKNGDDVLDCVANVFWSAIDNLEHFVLLYNIDNKKDFATKKRKRNKESPVLVRIHSECFTGNVFKSMTCDCNEQLQKSIALIKERGQGIVIYHNGHEGRGIGLANKIKAYKLQQEDGLDTIDANIALGLPNDSRNYETAYEILRYYGIETIDLITNNPEKINFFTSKTPYIVKINLVVNLKTECCKYNHKYLYTKKNKLNHELSLARENRENRDKRLKTKDFQLFDFSNKEDRERIKDFIIAIVKTRWNKGIVDALHEDCISALLSLGVKPGNIVEYEVPGAYEIPFQCQQVINLYQKVDCVIALGVLLKGETPHFDFISQTVLDGIMKVQLDSCVPIILGVLTCNTLEQAIERSSSGKGFAYSAIKMALNL